MKKRRRDILLVAALCAVMIGIVFGIEWLKKDETAQPQSLVTTFSGDAHTSRAFTWHTKSTNAATVVQLVKGEGGKADFSGADVITVEGEASVIDIGSGNKQGVHKAEATGLEPETIYSYRVGSGVDKEWSSIAIFMTEAQNTNIFSFINVTDSQGVTEQDFALWGKTLNKAFETFPAASFIVHNGDFTEEPEDEEAWFNLFTKAQTWVTKYPLMPVTGNHDEVDGDADRFVSHFNVPDNGAEDAITGTSYSFDYGTAHIVVLNTESEIKAQTKWLREDLANTDQPWLIAAIHRPAYGGNSYKKIDDWVDVFDEYGVDLVLQGHNHEYARSYPMKDGEIAEDGKGTVYVVTNTAGPKFNEKKDDQFYHAVHFQNEKQMFAGISVNGDTLTYEAYDVDGSKLDEFVIQH